MRTSMVIRTHTNMCREGGCVVGVSALSSFMLTGAAATDKFVGLCQSELPRDERLVCRRTEAGPRSPHNHVWQLYSEVANQVCGGRAEWVVGQLFPIIVTVVNCVPDTCTCVSGWEEKGDPQHLPHDKFGPVAANCLLNEVLCAKWMNPKDRAALCQPLRCKLF